MFWPELPVVFPAGEAREMRLVTAQDAAGVDASLPVAEREETFRFFTFSPFPFVDFVADSAAVSRRSYALYDRSGSTALACTTLYNCDRDTGTVMLGYTWVIPAARGNGGAANREMKSAMYRVLREAGVREVWFRADVKNLRSCRSMEKNGAQRMHIEDAPRVYEGRPEMESQSVFYRKIL